MRWHAVVRWKRRSSGIGVGGVSGVGGARRRVATALLVVLPACAAVAVGCGGVLSPDLFVVTREGSTPGAKLALLVNEEGVVRCNPRGAHPSSHHLSDPEIIEARTIQEDLHDPASRHEAFAPAPGSVLRYRVRDQDGNVSFADNSRGQPAVTRRLASFVLKVAQEVCRLPQRGA